MAVLPGVTIRNLFIHLRLHFQLLLAPVFLWGWLMAGGGLNAQVLLAFVAFHAFLYGGVTAFNSAYDRDVGPVGGLEHPPPVQPALLPFSIAVQLAGWALSALVNVAFAVTYGIFLGLSVAYSHPRIRLKAHPLSSLAVVGIGQGALAFVAAWLAARGGELSSMFSGDAALGALTAVLLILGLYPLTQLYQIDEDAARGDRTVAVAWGARACFAFSLVCTLLGGAAMLSLLVARFGAVDALLVGVGLLGQIVAVGYMARTFAADQLLRTFRLVMRLNVASATALSAYLLVRLALTF